MLKHFVIEHDSDGNVDLDVFDTLEQAAEHINYCASSFFTDMLEDYEEGNLDICVSPRWGCVYIKVPGHEYDRVWVHKSLEI